MTGFRRELSYKVHVLSRRPHLFNSSMLEINMYIVTATPFSIKKQNKSKNY